MRKGSHHRPSLSRLLLSADECIVQVAVRVSKWMECCVFETSAGRRFQVGGRGSRWAPKEKHASEWTHAGVTQLLLMPRPHEQPQSPHHTAGEAGVSVAIASYQAVAFTYGIGGHVHNLGVYYQPLWAAQPQPTTSSTQPSIAHDTAPTAGSVLTVSTTPATSVAWSGNGPSCIPVESTRTTWCSAGMTQPLPPPSTVRLPLLTS